MGKPFRNCSRFLSKPLEHLGCRESQACPRGLPVTPCSVPRTLLWEFVESLADNQFSRPSPIPFFDFSAKGFGCVPKPRPLVPSRAATGRCLSSARAAFLPRPEVECACLGSTDIAFDRAITFTNSRADREASELVLVASVTRTFCATACRIDRANPSLASMGHDLSTLE